MAVLINLLPDVRIAKEKAAHQRQMAISISTLVTAGSVGLIVLLLLINGALSFRISQLTNDIKADQSKLEATQGLKDAFTAQQHLAALPALYDQRVKATKLLTVLAADSPSQFSLSSMSTDEAGAIKISGTARSYATIQKFATAVEKSNHTAATAGNDFTNVVLTSASSGTGGAVGFTLTASVNPEVTGNGK